MEQKDAGEDGETAEQAAKWPTRDSVKTKRHDDPHRVFVLGHGAYTGPRAAWGVGEDVERLQVTRGAAGAPLLFGQLRLDQHLKHELRLAHRGLPTNLCQSPSRKSAPQNPVEPWTSCRDGRSSALELLPERKCRFRSRERVRVLPQHPVQSLYGVRRPCRP